MNQIILFFLISTISLNGYAQKNSIVSIDSVIFNLPSEDWKLTGNYEEGGQYMFENKKAKQAVSISSRYKTKFEFYKEGLSDFDLVNVFFKWDADYWKTVDGCEVNEIKRDSVQKFIIWILKTPKGENYSLYGLKHNHLIGINIDKKSFPKNEAIGFLEKAYLN